METPTKICPRCLREFPATLDYFHKNKGHKDGMHSYCKTCNNAQSIEWGRAHRQRRQKSINDWKSANKDKVREGSRRTYEKHKEHHDQSVRRWKRANTAKMASYDAKRRARKTNAPGAYNDADVARQYKAQKGHCYWCNISVNETYHVDHIVPLARGGSNSPDNLVIACAHCNLSRQDKLPHEWPEGGRLL